MMQFKYYTHIYSPLSMIISVCERKKHSTLWNLSWVDISSTVRKLKENTPTLPIIHSDRSLQYVFFLLFLLLLLNKESYGFLQYLRNVHLIQTYAAKSTHIFIWLFCKLGGLFICCCCYYNDAIKRVCVCGPANIHPFIIIIYHWTTLAIKLTETWKDMQFNQIQTILRTTRNTSVSDTMSRHVIHSVYEKQTARKWKSTKITET